MNAIGARFFEERALADPMPNDIVVRWDEVVKQGLPSEEKIRLIKKYPPPKNALIIEPPKLNEQVAELLHTDIIDRDKRIIEKQSKLSASQAAIAKMLSKFLDKEKVEKGEVDVALVENLCDIGRLLADLQHDEACIRKKLIVSNVKDLYKKTLREAISDEWLFGVDLGDKIKSKRSLQQDFKDVVATSKRTSSSKGSKNWNTPPHQKPPIQKPSIPSGYKSSNQNRSQRNQRSSKKRHHSSHQRRSVDRSRNLRRR